MKYKKLFNWGLVLLAILIYGGIYYVTSKEQILADRIRASVGKDISSTQDLYLVGFGGQRSDKFEKLILSFEGYKEIDVTEARKLIVYGMSKFIDEVNATKAIRPYLTDDPFTAKNIEITIWLYKDSERTDVGKNQIWMVETYDGIIQYHPGGPRKPMERNPVLVETYEEALAALEQESIQAKETLQIGTH